ncbi:hypothetical protein T492DRAFT_894530 [Pavlovales sp. CCMP2436]|nr:hypothetical protein T492DRAFT_894530 [Pavlovales sp. CCMP2436]
MQQHDDIPALVAAAPKASSVLQINPAQMPRKGTAAATAPDPSAGICDKDKDSEVEVDDVTKFAATCFVDGPIGRSAGTRIPAAPRPEVGPLGCERVWCLLGVLPEHVMSPSRRAGAAVAPSFAWVGGRSGGSSKEKDTRLA